MIYYTINKILRQKISLYEHGVATIEPIVYDDDGRSITFPDLETAESYYEHNKFNKFTHHIAIHEAEDDDAWKWATDRFWFGRRFYRKTYS
tara:strand:- start:198 stop:470 length:273 start_codon:yes stop_codon:yes gene_type:complete